MFDASLRLRFAGSALCLLAIHSVGMAQVAGNSAAPASGSAAPDQTHRRGTIHGVVSDPLGADIAGAKVELISGETVLATALTDGNGKYALDLPSNGRFRLRSSAATFDAALTAPQYFDMKSSTAIDLIVATPTLTDEITVTATGTPTPLAQVAAAVTVIESDQFPHVRDIQEPLRYVPGVQMTQTGQAGGTSSLYIRGGNSNATKVLIDGIPVNDLGGAAEFANIASAGIARIEVLREPDSALYGSEALAGVVSLTTKRGSTPLPQMQYSIDGGNFNTWQQDAALSGAFRRGTIPGLALLPLRTVMLAEKTTRIASGRTAMPTLFGQPVPSLALAGYEIHVGESQFFGDPTAFALLRTGAEGRQHSDGCISADGRTFGTYLHGLFDEDEFRHAFLAAARGFHGLAPALSFDVWKRKREHSFNRLADAVRSSVDLHRLFGWVGLPYSGVVAASQGELR